MKVKVFLLAVGASLLAFDADAQTGVQTGTPFGSGEDSIRCITNISLFTPYARSNNFKDAYEFWKIVYDECPGAHKDIYLYGTRIVAWQIANEQDPAKKAALINDLMEVYDKRLKYFGDDNRYGKDWIIARKANDYIQYMGDKADPKVLYGWLKEVVDEFGNKVDPMAVSLYMYASYQLFSTDENHKGNYVEDYLKAGEILDAQLAAATAANNENQINTVTTYKSTVDNAFANSGAADCETLQSLYGDKIEQNKDNLQYLKETIALLRRMRCHETEAYFAASEYAHRQEPTAESAMGLARRATKQKDYEAAITYFEEAANMESDPVTKGEDYYLIAAILLEQNNYSRARQYAQKAIEANPNYGAPYLLIGRMYAATASSVYPNDAVMRKTVYYAAVDKFERAKQVDSSVAGDANTLINTYRAYFPSTEEIFMHPDLEKGKSITIPGWINERTTIR